MILKVFMKVCFCQLVEPDSPRFTVDQLFNFDVSNLSFVVPLFHLFLKIFETTILVTLIGYSYMVHVSDVN